MTREEAKIMPEDSCLFDVDFIDDVRARFILDWENYNKCVDKIYNDFESRTCENCKHYVARKPFSDSSAKFLDCGIGLYNNVYIHQKTVNYPPSDFGCNKFERKTDGDV